MYAHQVWLDKLTLVTLLTINSSSFKLLNTVYIRSISLYVTNTKLVKNENYYNEKNKTNKQNTFLFLSWKCSSFFWIVSILFLSIFPICDMLSRIWNRRGDYIDFINFCLFSVYLGTYNWSVVLPSNVTDLKYAQWLSLPGLLKSELWKWLTLPLSVFACMASLWFVQ